MGVLVLRRVSEPGSEVIGSTHGSFAEEVRSFRSLCRIAISGARISKPRYEPEFSTATVREKATQARSAVLDFRISNGLPSETSPLLSS